MQNILPTTSTFMQIFRTAVDNLTCQHVAKHPWTFLFLFCRHTTMRQHSGLQIAHNYLMSLSRLLAQELRRIAQSIFTFPHTPAYEASG
jgi:hypothetical protein